MIPGSNPYMMRVFGAPEGEETTVHPLEVAVLADAQGNRVFASCWDVEDADLDALRAGADLWLTVWAAELLPMRVHIGPRPDVMPSAEILMVASHDAEGHVVVASRWSVSPEQIAQLADGERLWVLIRSEGLPPACLEAATVPYFAR